MWLNSLLCLSALFVEAYSLPLLMAVETAETRAVWLLTHTLAAGLMATGLYRLLPPHHRRAAFWSWLLLFALALFLPVLGIIGLALAALAGYWLPHTPADPHFVVIKAPVYRHLKQVQTHSGNSSEHAFGGQPSTEMRMKGLLAIQHMPTRYTATVMREALADQVDDLRLLAYGLLEAKEHQLMLRVRDALSRRDTQPPAARGASARELAELYWEMVYQNLVQGDMRLFALEQVALYAQEALDLDASDGGVWVIYGRTRLLQGLYSAAEAAFKAAIEHGFLPVRVSPYIAELAFLRRDFDSVRALMHHNLPEGRLPQLRQAAIYWRHHDYHE